MDQSKPGHLLARHAGDTFPAPQPPAAGSRRRQAALAAALLLAPLTAAAAEHPSLVKPDPSTCAVCHESLFENRPAVHPPAADDCTICHDVTIADDGTTVSLMEDEPALCVMCHDAMETAASGDLAAAHPPAVDSCVTCHDPHAGAAAHLLAGTTTETCTACHDLGDLDEPHGGQLTESTDCAACHDPHGSENARMLQAATLHRPFADGSCSGCHRDPFGDRVRMRRRGARLCTACHGEFEAGDGGSRHAALEDDRARAGCLNCHDPHMSDNPSVTVARDTDLCGSCHGDVVEAARAESGHMAAADDCSTCHQPHVSDLPRLLEMPGDELCTACHDTEDETLVGAHLGADLASVDCLSCHDPHGTGNDSLLAANVHAAIEFGCETCHEGSASALVDGGDSPLCLACHSDVGDAAAEAEAPHMAMEMASCADCHNPHASAQARLVKEPGGAVCTACHDGQAPEAGEVSHGVIDVIGCQACHEPHGGSRPMLLRREGDALCLSCHDARAISPADDEASVLVLDRFEIPAAIARPMASVVLSADKTQGHPIPNHRTAGAPTKQELRNVETTFDGELTCTTCHDPHKGRSSRLLNWNAATSLEACTACHPK